MSATSRSLRRLMPRLVPAVDLPIVALVALLTVPLSTFGIETTVESRDHDAFAVALLVLFPVVLLWRRSHPLVTVVVESAMATAYAARSYSPTFAVAALWVALYSAGRHGTGRARPVLVAVAIAAPGLTVWIAGDRFADAVVDVLIDVAMFLIGSWLRRRDLRLSGLEKRTVELEAERAEHARQAIALERRRIARELHDVIAHGLGVIVVQASGARHILAGTEAEAPLQAIDEAGREAIAEMRTLLSILREDDAQPLTPRASQLNELVDQVRSTGLNVSLEIRGAPRPLPPLVDLSLYRIVQEGLTNVAKHASGASSRVEVAYESDAVTVAITNGPGQSNGAAEGSGFGLLGMRERVAVLKGSFAAEATPTGGFEVKARLPLPDADPRIVLT